MRKNDYKQYADLLIKARAGDDEAFREIYRRTQKAQIYHLRNILGDTEEVMDTLQEVYILLYQNLDKINPPTVLIAYLNRLTYHVGQNMQRKEGRRNRTFITLDWLENMEGEVQPETENSMDKSERIYTVRKAISQLPELERSVIFMRYYQRLKQKDVALSLGVSLDKAKNLQRAAHKKLEKILKGQGFSTWGVLPAAVFYPEEEAGCVGMTGGAAPTAGMVSIKALPGVGTIGASAAVLGVTALIMFGIGTMGKTAVLSARAVTEPGNGTARIEVKVDSKLPVRRVILRNESGEEKSGRLFGGKEYRLTADRNGTYRVIVESNGGSRASQTIEVTGLDDEMPQIIGIRSGNGGIIVRFADNLSGVDYEKLYCESRSGEITEPKETNPKLNEAVFKVSKEDQILHFCDKAGNAGQIPLYHRGEANADNSAGSL